MKISDKVKGIIKTVAPTLGLALGGPLGGLAGNVLSSILGETDPAKIEEILVSQNPDTMLKLKQAEHDFISKMRELDIKEEDLYLKDVDSARQREVQVKDKLPGILAGLIIGGFFAVVYSVLSGEAKIDTVLAGTIIGYVSAKADQVLSYYFGSTRGSAAKNDVIAHLANKDKV